jgi:hypothetical protein
MDGRLHVYWLKPGMDLMDGLQCIETDKDIVDMIEAAKVEKTLSIMVDHTNFLKTIRYDVLVNGGRKNTKPIEVPAGEGISSSLLIPPSVPPSTVHAEGTRGGVDSAEDVDNDSDSDTDCSFADSDFDVEDGDDDLFADNVDREVDDHNEPDSVFELEDDDALQDTTLNLRLEEEQHLKNKFKEFNPKIDMQNPIFKAGMNFSCVEELRKALNAYSVKNKVKVNKLKNDRTRITAVCKPGCPWFLRATKDSRTEGFTIKKLYTGKHTCRGSWDLKALTSPFLTERFLDEIRDNQKISLKTFAAKVQRQFNMCPNRWKLSRARREALSIINGDEDAQFSLLLDFGQELRKSNPGSKFFLTTNRVQGLGDEEAKEHLATLYWSFDACKRGFLRGCRPLICVDGCHIKTKYKGILLSAVGIDPNDCIFPIAMGLVEVECTSSWEWFMTTLRDDLNITNTSPYTIMSDKQKVCNLQFSHFLAKCSCICNLVTFLLIISGTN